MFKLILIIMTTYGTSNGVATVNLPEEGYSFVNIESCDSAAKGAIDNYQENSTEPMPRIAWTCVKIDKYEPPENTAGD